MPLLSNKLYILNKIKKDKKDEESLFCHSLTNEICENEEEFKRKTFLYNQKIWTCRITGQINLTFKEAMKSEQSWAKMLKTSFKKCFEASVLQFVHHSKESLDTLVHKAWTQIHHEFCVNEPVTIKLTTPKEMILKGVVVKVDRSKANEDKEPDNSPNKLNSDASSSDKENIKKKIIPVKMDKLVKDIPAETIDRTLRPPSKDQIRMFIRAHAIRHSGKQNFPWVVDDDLVKKYRLPVLEPEFVVDKLKMKELSHVTEIQMYNKIREESCQKENDGACVDLTTSDDENDKNSKSKKSGEISKNKKKLKQATLFDISMTGPQNGPPKSQIRSPLSSPTRSLPPLAQRLLKLMKDNPNDLAVKQLIFKCCQLFSNQQINKFPDIIKIPIKERKEKLDEKKRIDAMTPEDREAYLTARRNQLRAQLREKKREENIKLEDIEIEYTKKIPNGTPVVMCDGLTQDQWIRLLSMSEFFRCYKRLLVPTGTVTNDNNGVICIDELCLSVVSNNDREHAVLAELVCVLLKTLLQDNHVRNRREMGLGLAELAVTACTAGELLRLVLLLGDDKKEVKNCDDVENDNEDVEDNKESLEDTEESEMLTHNYNEIAGPICEKLQATEFYDLTTEDKISVLELLQSRILELDMVSSFIDEYQREACEAYKKKVSDTKEYNDKLKTLRQNKQSVYRTITETVNTSSGNGAFAANSDNVDTNQQLANSINEEQSQVARRRQSIEMKLKESEEKEKRIENERQLQKMEKEEGSYRKLIEQCQKAYSTAINDARQLMRVQPLGCDRFFRRYWHFCTAPGAIYVEKELNQSGCNFGEPIQTEWTIYKTPEEIVEVIDSLCEKGIRESFLRMELESMLPRLKEEMNREENGPRISDSLKNQQQDVSHGDDQSFLVRGFKHELRETELSIRSGSLGGVENYDLWNRSLIDAVKIEEMKQALVSVFLGVHERFLNSPLKSCNGRNEFLNAVEQAQTQGRLNVLQSFLDSCVCWSKSAKDDKCRVCRKSSDENAMLLCDSCNHAFHTFCLRPPLHDIPDGEWFCPHCKPVSRARDNEGHNDSTASAAVTKSKTRQGAGSEQCCVCHIRSNDQLAKCTSCKKCFHAQCHEPPLRQIRRMNWHCCECRLDEVSSHKVKQAQHNSNRSRSSVQTERQEDIDSNDEQVDDCAGEVLEKEIISKKNVTVKKTTKKQQPTVSIEPSNGVCGKRKKSLNNSIKNGPVDEEGENVSGGDDEMSGIRSSRASRKRARNSLKNDEPCVPASKDRKVSHVSDADESDQEVENLSNLFTKRTARKRGLAAVDDSNDDIVGMTTKRSRNSVNEISSEKIEKACQSMLKHLMNHKASWPFREPVNPEEVPDYYQIISEPMDLAQMKDKCRKGSYRGGVESLKLFLSDIGQIFFNAEEYNLPDSQIMEMAVILEDFFKSIYSKYNFGVDYSRLC